MYRGNVEVRRWTPAMRAFNVAVLVVGAGFFAFTTWQESGPSRVLLGAIGFGLLWAALFEARLPEIAATADAGGITYCDGRLGVLLVFTDERAAWSDVLEIHTRRVTAKGGSFLRTSVRVRGPGGDGTRRFTVTSRGSGYAEFLAALREGTSGTAVTLRGLGLVEDGVESALRSGREWRLVAIVIALLGALVAILVASLRR